MPLFFIWKQTFLQSKGKLEFWIQIDLAHHIWQIADRFFFMELRVYVLKTVSIVIEMSQKIWRKDGNNTTFILDFTILKCIFLSFEEKKLLQFNFDAWATGSIKTLYFLMWFLETKTSQSNITCIEMLLKICHREFSLLTINYLRSVSSWFLTISTEIDLSISFKIDLDWNPHLYSTFYL